MSYTQIMPPRLLWLLHFGFLLAIGITQASAGAIVRQSSPGTNPDPSQVLTERAHQFYSLLQLRQISQAEEYVTKATRSRLKDMAGGTFLAFRVISADVKPDGKSADVVIEMTVMVPSLTAPAPVQTRSQWLLEEGEWRFLIPAAPPATNQNPMATRMGGGEPPKPEELKFEGHRYWLGTMKPSEVKEARFPFTNVTDHVVTISEVFTDCDCLQVKTEKMEYQPGESGELVIEFDSSNHQIQYVQTIRVRTDPGDVKSYLTIGAMIDTPPRTAEGTASESSSSQ